MNNLRLFFNTRIEVTAYQYTPLSSDFFPVSSLANTLRDIGDTALAPVRYLFNGQTVHLEKKKDGSYGAGHVASFDKEVKPINCKGLDSRPESSEKSLYKTVLAIIFLIPGVLVALLTKLPVSFCAETKKYNELARLHFTPTNITLGKEKPFGSCKDILHALFDVNPLDQPVEALIIHGTSFKVVDEEEPGRLFESIPGCIARMNLKKIIFIGIDLGICNSIFSDRSSIQKLYGLRSNWDLCSTKNSLDEALQAKTDKPCYYVLKSETSAGV